jgi:transcriptional regulator with XRE-family HTH domain
MRREAAGWTRERLAVASGTSVATLARIENQGHTPTLTVLERIAHQLDTTAAELLHQAAAATS